MAFKLLNELQEIVSEDRLAEKYNFLLVERVDKLLGHLHAVLGNKEHALDDVDVEELSYQLAGLQVLGKRDYREAIDDFAKVDSAGVSKNFFKFLDQVDDPRQTKDFSDKRSADELLKYIAQTHAPSVVEQWKTAIEKAQNGDDTAYNKIKDAVAKMFQFYQTQYNKMKSHLKVGGSFDAVLADQEV